MAEVRISPSTSKYFKKLRDKRLKGLFKESIDYICEKPYKGQLKKGDLSGIYGYDFYYQGTNYEIAYVLEKTDSEEIIVIILAGTRENFYEQLKKYWL